MSFDPEHHEFDLVAELFGLPTAPTRLRIACELSERERGESELLEQVAESQPKVSQHRGRL